MHGTLKTWGLRLPCLEWGVSMKLFEILLQQRFVLSPLFMYLFNHYFIVLWIHGYVLYTLGYNPTLLCFVA